MKAYRTADNTIQLFRPEEGAVKELPMMYGYPENSRGLGLADMAKALRTGRPARCDVQQTYHVLEIIEGFETSARTGAWVDIESDYHRAPAMVRPALKGILDLPLSRSRRHPRRLLLCPNPAPPPAHRSRPAATRPSARGMRD